MFGTPFKLTVVLALTCIVMTTLAGESVEVSLVQVTPVAGTDTTVDVATSKIDTTITVAADKPSAAYNAFGHAGEALDALCLCGMRANGRGGCGDNADVSCDNPACESDEDCGEGRLCFVDSCCPGKPKLCVGICPDGVECSNPGSCESGFEECSPFESVCRYVDKKIKAKKGCPKCPELRPCGVSSNVECSDLKGCSKKFKSRIDCPGGRDGFCKIKSKRCECN